MGCNALSHTACPESTDTPAPYEGIALESLSALDEMGHLYEQARLDADVRVFAVHQQYQAQIDALEDIVADLQREVERKERVIERLLARNGSGRASPREALRQRLALTRLVSQSTKLGVAGHGHLAGACPFCGVGLIHVWLGIVEFYCDCCGLFGDSVTFYELRRDQAG